MDWPDPGVYFFATDEQRTDTDQLRLTHVSTHAVSRGSGTTIWTRLRTHRGSVFRERVGEALVKRYDLDDEYPE